MVSLRFSLTYRDLSGNQANAYTALDDEATRITVIIQLQELML